MNMNLGFDPKTYYQVLDLEYEFWQAHPHLRRGYKPVGRLNADYVRSVRAKRAAKAQKRANMNRYSRDLNPTWKH